MTESNSHIRKSKSKNNHSLLTGGKFALGVFSGIIISLSFYLLLDFLEIGLTRKEILDVVPVLLTLLVALTSLLISYHAFSEQRRMRQAGTDPVVLVHFEQRSDEPRLIMFNISNVGAGAAKNVQLSFDTSVQNLDEPRVRIKISKLTHPIRVIRQNQKVQYNFGSANELLGDKPVPPFEISVKYEDIEGEEYTSEHILDVREFTRQSADKTPIQIIANKLEAISKDIHGAATESKPLQVRTQTKAEYNAERQEFIEAVKANKKGQ